MEYSFLYRYTKGIKRYGTKSTIKEYCVVDSTQIKKVPLIDVIKDKLFIDKSFIKQVNKKVKSWLNDGSLEMTGKEIPVCDYGFPFSLKGTGRDNLLIGYSEWPELFFLLEREYRDEVSEQTITFAIEYVKAYVYDEYGESKFIQCEHGTELSEYLIEEDPAVLNVLNSITRCLDRLGDKNVSIGRNGYRSRIKKDSKPFLYRIKQRNPIKE